MTRRVTGLRWARRLEERPAGLPIGRPRGKKRAGVQYERQLAGALPNARHGLWWEFEDRYGKGICQTDLVMLVGQATVVLEAKLTWTEDAWDQLEGLYLPVVRMAMAGRVVGVQVCKNLLPQAKWVSVGLEEAVLNALADRRATLHWMGLAPLLTDSRLSFAGAGEQGTAVG